MGADQRPAPRSLKVERADWNHDSEEQRALAELDDHFADNTRINASLRKASGPIYLVEDVHNTGESWMAMRQLLEDTGVPVAGVATLSANELPMTSARDIERLSQKLATLTVTPIAETTSLLHVMFHDCYKKWFNKAEQSATGDPRQALRLLDAARAHARARAAQRTTVSGSQGILQSQGHQNAVAASNRTTPSKALVIYRWLTAERDRLAQEGRSLTPDQAQRLEQAERQLGQVMMDFPQPLNRADLRLESAPLALTRTRQASKSACLAVLALASRLYLTTQREG